MNAHGMRIHGSSPNSSWLSCAWNDAGYLCFLFKSIAQIDAKGSIIVYLHNYLQFIYNVRTWYEM